jgi:hypothetical protein
VNQVFEAPHPNGAVRVKEKPRRRRVRRQLLLAVAVVIGLAWGYAIWFSVTQKSPERLDRASRTAVANACTTARDELEALPDLTDRSTAADNVALVRNENDVLTRMTDRIDGVQPRGGDARAALQAWARDWRDLITARATFATDLAADGSARLRIPTVRRGSVKPISERMDEYATQRGLDGCRPQSLQVEVVDGPRDYTTTGN